MSAVVPRAIRLGLVGCHVCGLVSRTKPDGHMSCPRCGSALHIRKIDSISRTWALLLTAMLMYIPAMALPVMKTSMFGSASADTIMSGVVYFLMHGDWPLALVIFTASVLVPLLKMLALIYLLVSVQRNSSIKQKEKTRLYRITELVGRWSMVDVFVVALLAALVQLGAIISIEPDWGALAFSGMVILTMLAAMAFDPRLIWDVQERIS